jgi:hypothetical protein
MQNLFQPSTIDELMTRLDKLEPASPRQWGKMDVAQMLAHCSTTMDMASGRTQPPRLFIGRLIGRLARPVFTNDRPFSRNGPTHPQFRIVDDHDFHRERDLLRSKIREFHAGGEAKCTRHPHPFFGQITPHEWATGMYKHLDHHLRQFAV